MKHTETTSDAGAASRAARRNRELLLAASALLVGLLVLPALIYLVGTVLLGAYGGGPHLGSFYGDFVRNLGSGSLRTWFLVLSPYVFLALIRLIFKFQGRKVVDETETDEKPTKDSAQTRGSATRRDPFVSP